MAEWEREAFVPSMADVTLRLQPFPTRTKIFVNQTKTRT